MIVNDLNLEDDNRVHATSLDSVVLADFVKINRTSKRILEIGIGNGIISMLLSQKSSASIDAYEINDIACNLAKKNCENNNIDINIVCKDILEDYKNIQYEYDIIVSNPPYFKENNENQKKKSEYMRLARNEANLTIEKICEISKRLLKNKGHLYLIFRVDRIAEVFSYLKKNRLEPKHLGLLITKKDENPIICVLDSIKNGSSGLKISNIDVSTDEKKRQYYEKR